MTYWQERFHQLISHYVQKPRFHRRHLNILGFSNEDIDEGLRTLRETGRATLPRLEEMARVTS